MRKGRFIKAGMVLSVTFMALLFMTGLCAADSVLEDSPLGEALDKLDQGLEEITALLTPGDDAQGSVDANASMSVGADVSVPDPEAAPAIPAIPGAGSLPEALDPSELPGLDTLAGALDPANLTVPDTLAGALDPANLPAPDSLPGMEGLQGLPEFPALDPMEVVRILDTPEELFVVLTLDGLLEAELGLGKNLEEAPLLELRLALFDALSAEGKAGIRRIGDDAFLVPLELYLKYRIGDKAWREILDLVAPLEISFPGAGQVPDGVQTIVDTVYKYVLRPILSPLPINREIKPGEQPEEDASQPPAQPETTPGAAVAGEEATPGGSGDHLPFTGVELKILLALLVVLAVFIPLLRKLEKTVGKRMD